MKAKRFVRLVAALAVVIACISTSMLSTAYVNISQKSIVTNYPNPFDSRNESTTILYVVSGQSVVNIKIYDLLGILVRDYSVIDNTQGTNKIVWDGTNDSGQKVAKGGYICVLDISSEAGRTRAIRKIGVLH